MPLKMIIRTWKTKMVNILRCLNVDSLRKKLVSEHFPDLSRENIEILVRPEADQKTLFAEVGRGINSSDGYVINGLVPEEIVRSEEGIYLLKGILGHELSHIANGDLVGFKGLVTRNLGLDNLVGKRYYDGLDKAADRTTIARGLGRELLDARVYNEKQIGPCKSSYTVEQLKKLGGVD